MHFIVIMAFALVLSDALPPDQCLLSVFRPIPGREGVALTPLLATLAVIAVQLLIVAGVAGFSSRLTLARLDGTSEGHDRAADTYSTCQLVLLSIYAVAVAVTLIFTPWAPLVRDGWGLGRIPLLGDLAALGPFAASLLIGWTILYRVELRIRKAALALAEAEAGQPAAPQANEATAALALAKKRYDAPEPTLGLYLLDKCRHQVLIVAVPMAIIAFAKYFTDLYKDAIVRATTLPWAADAALGTVSAIILGLAPLLLRYTWATEPLPEGPLRDRFVRTCRRIGLRYREILLWHTHGTAINAAVMGFVAPLRYIMVSDALLETMSEEEIEAVFGHEAGHVHHWHLHYFILFGIISMYVAGGAMLICLYAGTWWHVGALCEQDVLQLAALAALMATWLLGFGWVSRRFERQADLYGIRCVTPDIMKCVEGCPVHGRSRDAGAIEGPRSERCAAGLCTSAANLFGRTLLRIADLNGISRETPSWRHGSIGDRCRLIERLTADEGALRRFDRKVWQMKVGLIVATIIGTGVTGLIYGGQVLNALHSWFGK